MTMLLEKTTILQLTTADTAHTAKDNKLTAEDFSLRSK
jgi:hypothetical protein